MKSACLRVAAAIGGVFALLGMPAISQAQDRLPSCLEISKLGDIRPKPPSTEFLLMVDETTAFDGNLKDAVERTLQQQLHSGDAFVMASFSAYAQGRYLKIWFEGQLDGSLAPAIRNSLPKRQLAAYDKCLVEQKDFSHAKASEVLRSIFSRYSDNLGQSDILGSLREFSKRIRTSSANRRVLLLASDMLEHSSVTSFYSKSAPRRIDPAAELRKVETTGLLAEMANAQVYVLGAGLVAEDGKRAKGVYRDEQTMKALEDFWRRYFEKSGALLKEFGKPQLLNPVK